jgi:hypothetical protein
VIKIYVDLDSRTVNDTVELILYDSTDDKKVNSIINKHKATLQYPLNKDSEFNVSHDYKVHARKTLK